MRESREEGYLRRMRALGYEPSLAGMDDEDIEWELNKMDEAGRRREAPSQPVRTVYRPVDPGLAARIFRQMGRPYDPQAISPKQSFYINGWYGDDEGDGTPAEPMPYRPREKEAIEEPPYKTLPAPVDPGLQKIPIEEYIQLLSASRARDGAKELSYSTSGNSGDREAIKAGPLEKVVGPGGEIIQKGIEVERFKTEVEEEALKNGDSEALARRKGVEAGLEYAGYLTTVAETTAVANRVPRYGPAIATGVGTAGTAAGAYAVKPWIKKYVLGKGEADYNKESKESLFPGSMPPGPG